jgi:predicted ATP-dependent endonuclease of OLD family
MHGEAENSPVSLKDLSEGTAKYFMKAPAAGILEFTISQKVVLVEGPSEYMLFERFYETVTGHVLEQDDVHIIDVRGLSFKRYLEIAQLLRNKVAVVTDNDGDKQKHCVDKYVDFADNANIKICYEQDENKKTFEVVLHADNQELCNNLFIGNAQEYMLKNKTESAYKLLDQEDQIIVPEYIRGAIEWIKE